MKNLGQFVIKAADNFAEKPDRYFHLQPEHGGRIVLMENLGMATAFSYPEAWLVLQLKKAQVIATELQVTLSIATLVDFSSLGISGFVPTLDHREER